MTTKQEKLKKLEKTIKFKKHQLEDLLTGIEGIASMLKEYLKQNHHKEATTKKLQENSTDNRRDRNNWR